MKNILQIIQEAKNNAPTEIEKLKLSKSLTGVTLLSIEEYNEYKDSIPSLNMCWWLRSSGSHDKFAAVVDNSGFVFTGMDVSYYDLAVRPTFKITNLESLKLQIKDQFEFETHEFTIISDNLAICNDTLLRNMAFCRDGSSNDYEMSDVKKYIEDWFDVCKKN